MFTHPPHGTAGSISNNSDVPGASIDDALNSLYGGSKVANGSNLATLTVDDGSVVFVKTFRDWFQFREEASGSIDNSNVLSASTSVGRWERLGICHPSWATQQTWVIDPTLGDNENSGSVAAPIKTWAELIRRVGFHRFVTAQTTITLSGSLPTTDPMIGQWQVVNGAKVIIQGATTVVFTGSLSAKQDLNTAANVNTETRATSTWTVASYLNQLVQDTTNSRYSWIARDMGGNQARLSPWMAINETNGGVTIANGNSTISASLVVHTIPTVAAFQFAVFGTAGATTPCLFQKIDFTSAGGTARFFSANSQNQFQNCKFTGAIRFGAGNNVFNNCWFGADGAYPIDYSAYLRLNGGICTVTWPLSTTRPAGNSIELRNSVLFHGATLNLNIGTFCNIIAADFRSITGSAINVTQGSNLQLNGTLNGSDITSASIAFQPCTSGQWIAAQVFAISSSVADIVLGGQTSAFAFDASLGTYITVPRTTSFANLTSSIAAGGFANSINDPRTGVRFALTV